METATSGKSSAREMSGATSPLSTSRKIARSMTFPAAPHRVEKIIQYQNSERDARPVAEA